MIQPGDRVVVTAYRAGRLQVLPGSVVVLHDRYHIVTKDQEGKTYVYPVKTVKIRRA